MSSVNDEFYSVEEENNERKRIKLGTSGTSNKGITWFGSSFVGPGNLLCDSEGHFNAKALPTSDIDKVAFQHDADYFNATDVSKDNIWELDKKAIRGALQVSDPYFGNIATALGLIAKRGVDLADQFLTGSETSIYPNKPNTSGTYFDTTPYLAAADSSRGVEEDPDLDWDYDGNGNPNSGETSGDHVANTSAPDNSTSNGNGGSASGSMASSSGSGSKRPADSSGSEPAPKRAGGTSLPGTAAANDGDPDTGNPSSENAVIPRPIGHTGGYTMVYRKVHTFVSYGCGWKVLRYLNTDNAYLGTTSLMSVPVDQPWFYMSPSEFKFLPRGAICTEVKCKGVMRNPRTAFETNSSTSSLATLNQNKFMVKADALNLKTRGFNRKLTFGNSSEPMDPTNTENDQSSMKEFVRKLYGQDLDGSFSAKEGYELPASYMNLPLMYNSYFCNFVNRNHNSGKLGWERFNEHITKVDASFTVGTTVLNYSYKPHVGILTLPHDPIFDACVSVQEPNSSKFAMLRNAGNEPECQDFINAASGLFERRSDQKLTYVAENGWKRIFGNDRYCTNIDVGQYFRMFDKHEYSNKVQPSVHVGIYPVHKLTTATNSIVPVNFTDVECTWDFETEMTVSFGCPQSRTAFDRLHVEYEKTWLLADDNYNQNLYNRADLSIVHGLYVAPEKVADNQNAAAHSSGLTKEMGKASTTKNIDSFTTPVDATVTTPVPTSVRRK